MKNRMLPPPQETLLAFLTTVSLVFIPNAGVLLCLLLNFILIAGSPLVWLLMVNMFIWSFHISWVITHSFSLQWSMLLHGIYTVYVLMGIWVSSSLSLLQIILLQIFLYKWSGTQMYTFVLGVFLGREIARCDGKLLLVCIFTFGW